MFVGEMRQFYNRVRMMAIVTVLMAPQSAMGGNSVFLSEVLGIATQRDDFFSTAKTSLICLKDLMERFNFKQMKENRYDETKMAECGTVVSANSLIEGIELVQDPEVKKALEIGQKFLPFATLCYRAYNEFRQQGICGQKLIFDDLKHGNDGITVYKSDEGHTIALRGTANASHILPDLRLALSTEITDKSVQKFLGILEVHCPEIFSDENHEVPVHLCGHSLGATRCIYLRKAIREKYPKKKVGIVCLFNIGAGSHSEKSLAVFKEFFSVENKGNHVLIQDFWDPYSLGIVDIGTKANSKAVKENVIFMKRSSGLYDKISGMSRFHQQAEYHTTHAFVGHGFKDVDKIMKLLKLQSGTRRRLLRENKHSL